MDASTHDYFIFRRILLGIKTTIKYHQLLDENCISLYRFTRKISNQLRIHRVLEHNHIKSSIMYPDDDWEKKLHAIKIVNKKSVHIIHPKHKLLVR